MEITSINTNTYLGYLRRANSGDLPCITKAEGIERRVLVELIESGLLSSNESRCETGVTFHEKIYLTPEGAKTLQIWEAEIKASSLPNKIAEALTRVLWVFVGVIAALLPKLLNIE